MHNFGNEQTSSALAFSHLGQLHPGLLERPSKGESPVKPQIKGTKPTKPTKSTPYKVLY